MKRGKRYNVVYNYTDERGETKQKWESCKTYKEAQARKVTVESEMLKGTFIEPRKQTVEEFLWDFVKLYGEKKWGVSMYKASCALIVNYIIPLIGQKQMQEINPRAVDEFIQRLRTTPSVTTRTHKATSKYLTDSNIEKIFKLMRCAFKQAVRWEIIGRNPFDNAILPRTHYKKREIWNADTIRQALDACTESKLYIAMNLSFACSLRLGEILGLTWDNVHITDADIAADDAWIYIDKELTRATQRAIDMLGEKDVFYIFEPVMKNTATRLILKRPKTESSVRKVWLPKTVAYILREWQKAQTEMKEFLGSEYEDFNLVISYKNGRPCDARMIEKAFSDLKKEAGLPNVVFHSLQSQSPQQKYLDWLRCIQGSPRRFYPDGTACLPVQMVSSCALCSVLSWANQCFPQTEARHPHSCRWFFRPA